MNPPGMFEDGVRKVEWSIKNLLSTSGKLIPEFDRRRNIRDMFSRKASLPFGKSKLETELEAESDAELRVTLSASLSDTTASADGVSIPGPSQASDIPPISQPVAPSPQKPAGSKRVPKSSVPTPAVKRLKSGTQAGESNGSSKGQQSLKGFFKAKTAPITNPTDSNKALIIPAVDTKLNEAFARSHFPEGNLNSVSPKPPAETDVPVEDEAANFASKRTWGKLFSRPIAPKCEHNEPCKTMLTKKPGVNCGRSFWMCNRPLGPSGKQERSTEWRCNTFIWASDWDGHAGAPG